MGLQTETKRNRYVSIFLPAPTLRKSPKINREGLAFLCNKQAKSMPQLKTESKTFSVCNQDPMRLGRTNNVNLLSLCENWVYPTNQSNRPNYYIGLPVAISILLRNVSQTTRGVQ